TKLTDFYTRGKIAEIFPVDTLLLERPDLFPQLPSELEPIQTFRIRVIWMTARLSYEAPLFARSRESRLVPQKALYGPNHPARLASISELAMNACRDILRAPQ
ncbi:MAG TPA: hypothetical protein VFS85_07460, partial [Dongiaceae bacterium]|nr:hypothetical protein [Dongiaceae bacterium]